MTSRLNRPGSLGGSRPWKRGWSNGAQKQSKGPSLRRYTPAGKEQAVRLVRKLRDELGTEHGTVGRVACQLGYGKESVRSWVRQADIDEGAKPGVTCEQSERIKALEQENKELKRANEILRRASAYFAQAELDRPLR